MMDELEFEAGKVQGRAWMTRLLKTHDPFEAQVMSEEEKLGAERHTAAVFLDSTMVSLSLPKRHSGNKAHGSRCFRP